MSTTRTTVRIALSILLAAPPVASAWAGDFAECRRFSTVGSDRVIVACTTAIASGTLGQQDLAVAFAYRGAAFHSLQQDHQAFEDFARAILLDPGCTVAYHQRGLLHLDRGETEWAREDLGIAARIEGNSADARVEDF